MRHVILLILISTVAQADRGPWYNRSAAQAAQWTRYVTENPKRAVELTRGPLKNDVATCKQRATLAFVKCLGENVKKIDPQWILTPKDKLPTDAQKTFAKQFEKYTAFVVTTHARGNIVL